MRKNYVRKPLTNVTKFKTEKEKKERRAPKSPQMSQKSQKEQGLFFPAENTDDKYRKNRKKNKCNKIRYLEREEVKKGVEMFANVAKIFLVGLKYRVTNIAKQQ